jgi:hypothetical protein
MRANPRIGHWLLRSLHLLRKPFRWHHRNGLRPCRGTITGRGGLNPSHLVNRLSAVVWGITRTASGVARAVVRRASLVVWGIPRMAPGVACAVVRRASVVVWGIPRTAPGVAHAVVWRVSVVVHAPGHRVWHSICNPWSNHIPLSPSLGSRPPLGAQWHPPTGPTGRENPAKGSGRAAGMDMIGPWNANPARALVPVPPPT